MDPIQPGRWARRAFAPLTILAAMIASGCAPTLEMAPPPQPSRPWLADRGWNGMVPGGKPDLAGIVLPLPQQTYDFAARLVEEPVNPAASRPDPARPEVIEARWMPSRLPAISSSDAPRIIGKPQQGIASWYGGRWAGKKTANGEIYDPATFTAAHRTMPFNSIARVTNLKNGRSVQVRINNRGPFKKGRIIDLSAAAAKEIDSYRSGLADVEVVRVQ